MRLESWTWLIVPLGLCRAMQVAMHDRIFQRPREWVKAGHLGGMAAYLIGCPWCVSLELALLVALLLSQHPTRRPTLWVLLALAASLVAVAIDRVFDRLPLLADPSPPPTPPGVADAFERHEHPRS